MGSQVKFGGVGRGEWRCHSRRCYSGSEEFKVSVNITAQYVPITKC